VALTAAFMLNRTLVVREYQVRSVVLRCVCACSHASLYTHHHHSRITRTGLAVGRARAVRQSHVVVLLRAAIDVSGQGSEGNHVCL
jgi:hypothetical protein